MKFPSFRKVTKRDIDNRMMNLAIHFHHDIDPMRGRVESTDRSGVHVRDADGRGYYFFAGTVYAVQPN